MDDVAEFGALHVTLIIGVEPVLEPGIYLVEWRGRERVMDHDIVPLELVDQKVGVPEPARYRLEGHEIRLKLRRFDLSIIFHKVDAAKTPKEPTLFADLEFYFCRSLNAVLPLLFDERPELIQIAALDADYECRRVHSAKLPRLERADKRPLRSLIGPDGVKNFCDTEN